MTLQDKRVLVTRAEGDQGALEELLRARGAVPVHLPCVAFEDIPGAAERLAQRVRERRPDLVVVASAHAARRLFAALPDALAALDGIPLAAAGRGTAAALAALGRGDAIVPGEGVGADALVASLAANVRGRRVLVPRAEGGNPALIDGLSTAGASVDAIALYRTVVPPSADPAVLAALRAGEIDAVALASGSAARGFAQLAGTSHRATIVCMGRTCAADARGAGLRVDAVSDGGFPELCAALERAI